MSQSRLQSQNNNNDEQEIHFPPPPPFLDDNPISNENQRPTIRATGPGLNDGLVDDNCLYSIDILMYNFDYEFILGYFDLHAPNAELQKLVIAIDGPSKADIQIEVVDSDIYRVFYICQTPGNRIDVKNFSGKITLICVGAYHISLTYDGEHIDGSPYHLRLRSQPLQEQVVPPTLPPPLDPPRATIEPIEFHVCLFLSAYFIHSINLRLTFHR